MRRIIVLILTLALALFMLASCRIEECDTHVDSDKNGICDNCKADVSLPEDPDPENPDPECEHKDDNHDFICDLCSEELPNNGLILSEAVIHQLANAKTMKLEFNARSVSTYDEWYYDADEELNYTGYDDRLTNGLITFSLDSEGRLCAKIELTDSYAYEEDAEYDTYETVTYIADGSIYTYDEELDVYAKRELDGVDVAAITSTLEALTEGITVDEAQKNALLTEIGELAIKSFNILENKGSISIDLKDEATALLDYLAALDLENDTVRGILGDALALIDESLTVEALETEVFRVLGLTVNEALAEIDAWLTENYGTTLQGIYDSIINDPTVAQIIKNAIKMQLPEGEDVDEIFSTYLEFNIAEALEAEGLGDAVLFDLILSMIGAPSEDAPTLAQIEAQVGAILDMTLAEFEESMGMYLFSELKATGESITVNALNARLDINFKGIYNIDSISGSININLESNSPSEVEGKSDHNNVTVSMSFKLYGISEEPTSIVVPTDKDIYFDYYNSYLYGDIGWLSTSLYDGTLYFNLTIYNDRTVEVYAELADLEILKSTTVTIPGNALEFYCDGALLEHDEAASLIIEIDLAGDTFYVIQCPEYVLGPMPVTVSLD